MDYLALALLVAMWCLALACVRKDMEAPPPADPYRLDRWRKGEPMDPDDG